MTNYPVLLHHHHDPPRKTLPPRQQQQQNDHPNVLIPSEEDNNPEIRLRMRWIQLQRLLYCMEKDHEHEQQQQQNQSHSNYFGETKDDDDEEEEKNGGGIGGGTTTTTTTTISWQSWHFRAQQCHTLWNQILTQLETMALHHDDDDDKRKKKNRPEQQSTIRNMINVSEMTQRVDQACRKDFERAERFKPSHGDLMDRIFFRPTRQQQQQQQRNQEEEEGEETKDDDKQEKAGKEEKIQTNQLDPVIEEGSLDDVAEEEGRRDDPHGQPPPHHQHESQSRFRPTQSHPQSSNNIAELQKVQREQMEEAIAAMAERMKEATQGIQHQLQQQTNQTLNELERVAEQNVVDVTKVVRDVTDHNQRQRRRMWGTWTLLFTVVGIFVFCLMTIFTIPKRPNTCLIFCSIETSNGGQPQVSLVGWFAETIKVLSKYTIQPAYSLIHDLFQHDDDDEEEGRGQQQQFPANSAWEKMLKNYGQETVHHQDDDHDDPMPPKNEERNTEHQQQNSRVDQKLQVDWRDAPDDDDNDEDDDPFGGRKPVKKISTTNDDDEDDDDDPFGGRKPVKKIVHRQAFDDDDDDEDDDPFGGRKPVKKIGNRQAFDDDDDDPFGGRKPVKKIGNRQAFDDDDDDDPFGGRKPVKNIDNLPDEDDDDDDPFGGRKPVKKIDNRQAFDDDDDDDPFGGRKPVKNIDNRQAFDDDDDDPFGGRKPVKKSVESQEDDGFDADISEKPIKRKFAKPVDFNQPKEPRKKKKKPVEESAKNKRLVEEEKSFDNRMSIQEEIPIQSMEISPDGRVDEVIPEKIQNVNMNELLASLQRAAQKTKDEDVLAQSGYKEEVTPPMGGVLDGSLNEGGGGGTEPLDPRRVTPRDIRLAAEKADNRKLREFLEVQPGYVDRQDKKKSTALHLAARKGQTEAIQILHEFGVSLTILNEEGMTALQEAETHLDHVHPTIQLLRRLTGLSDDTFPKEVMMDEKVVLNEETSIPNEGDSGIPNEGDIVLQDESSLLGDGLNIVKQEVDISDESRTPEGGVVEDTPGNSKEDMKDESSLLDGDSKLETNMVEGDAAQSEPIVSVVLNDNVGAEEVSRKLDDDPIPVAEINTSDDSPGVVTDSTKEGGELIATSLNESSTTVEPEWKDTIDPPIVPILEKRLPQASYLQAGRDRLEQQSRKMDVIAPPTATSPTSRLQEQQQQQQLRESVRELKDYTQDGRSRLHSFLESSHRKRPRDEL